MVGNFPSRKCIFPSFLHWKRLKTMSPCSVHFVFSESPFSKRNQGILEEWQALGGADNWEDVPWKGSDFLGWCHRNTNTYLKGCPLARGWKGKSSSGLKHIKYIKSDMLIMHDVRCNAKDARILIHHFWRWLRRQFIILEVWTVLQGNQRIDERHFFVEEFQLISEEGTVL